MMKAALAPAEVLLYSTPADAAAGRAVTVIGKKKTFNALT